MTHISQRPLLLIDEHCPTADLVAESTRGMASIVRCRLSVARAFIQHDSYAAILVAVPDPDWLSLAPLIGDFAAEASTVVLSAEPGSDVALHVVRQGGQDALAGDELTPDAIRRVVSCAVVRGDEVHAMRIRARGEKRAAVRIVASVIRDALQPAMTTLARALDNPSQQHAANREALGTLQEVMMDLDEAGLAI